MITKMTSEFIPFAGRIAQVGNNETLTLRWPAAAFGSKAARSGGRPARPARPIAIDSNPSRRFSIFDANGKDLFSSLLVVAHTKANKNESHTYPLA